MSHCRNFFFQRAHAYSLVEQICGFEMATSEKLPSINNSKPLNKRFNYRPFNCGAYRNEQISSSKLPMVPHKKNQIFCTKMTTSEKFQLSYNSKPLKKQVVLYALHLQPNCGTYPIVQI